MRKAERIPTSQPSAPSYMWKLGKFYRTESVEDQNHWHFAGLHRKHGILKTERPYLGKKWHFKKTAMPEKNGLSKLERRNL